MAQPPSRRMGRPTLDEAVALEKKILDNALATLRTVGSEGFSIEQLAIDIGITKRTIYRRYKGKGDLIIAVVAREVERLVLTATPSPNNQSEFLADPILQLRLWIEGLFNYISEPGTILFYNYLCFEAAGNADIRTEFERWHRHVLGHCCDLIVAAQERSLIRSGDPRRFALLLLDLIAGVAGRLKLDMDFDSMFGGDSLECYFEFRWSAFHALVCTNPLHDFARLSEIDAGRHGHTAA